MKKILFITLFPVLFLTLNSCIAMKNDVDMAKSELRAETTAKMKILEENVEYTKREANLDSLNKVVFAHTGTPKRVMLRCKKRVLRYVIEQFGSDISVKENPDGSFDASVLTATEGLVYWALQYLQDVEVLSPPNVRQKIISAIKENPYGV